MTEARKLADWIDEQGKRNDVGPLVKLVCCHVVKGNKIGDEIRVVTAPAEIDEDWSAETAEKIIEQGATEAVTLATGIQRYAVQAFFKDDPKPHARHVFTCAGGNDMGGLATTEAPDGEGLVAQAMRHTEFFAQLSAQGHLSQVQSMQKELDALRRENAELRSDRLKSFKIMEEVYGAHAEREAAARTSAVKNRIFEETADKVGVLLPIAINHLAGKQILPEKSSQLLLVKSFVDSISRDQLTELERVLKPEQLASFVNIATSVSRPAPEPPAAPSNGVAP